ncbi:hypothetical protein BDN72DRAFT_382851 [Pluteus cervinus]|uniref:Uncharacterized protein n=1 Tax=Pluteus cervinus TaxID=181527 RepID=A0ACD3AAB7_9AGAR|nr:hypothetical protein BDN72DRAFT_382851 [Pluteus cervinus]
MLSAHKVGYRRAELRHLLQYQPCRSVRLHAINFATTLELIYHISLRSLVSARSYYSCSCHLSFNAFSYPALCFRRCMGTTSVGAFLLFCSIASVIVFGHSTYPSIRSRK